MQFQDDFKSSPVRTPISKLDRMVNFKRYLLQEGSAYKEKIVASPFGYRLAKGAFWSLIGNLISRGLGLISSIIVARLLGKTGYGEWGIIQGTVSMFGTFAGLGLGITATKYVAEFRRTNPAKAGRIIALSSVVSWTSGGVLTLILVSLAPWLSTHTLAAPQLSETLRLGSPLLILGAINGAQTGALAGFEAFKVIAQVNLWAGIASFPLMVCGVYFGGLKGALLGAIASLALNAVLNFKALQRQANISNIPMEYTTCWSEWKVLWHFSLPAVLANTVVAPVIWGSSALLVNQPHGYGEMGVYNAVMRVKQAPEMILSLLMAPLLPILSEQYGKGNKDGFNRTTFAAFLISCMTMVPFCLFFAAAPNSMLRLFGHDFMGYPYLVQWFVLHSALIGVFYPFGTILASMGKMWYGWAYNLAWAVMFLLMAFFLTPIYLSTGLALTWAVTHLFTGLIFIGYVYKRKREFIGECPLFEWLGLVLALFLLCAGSFLYAPSISVFVGIVTIIGFASFCCFMAYKRFFKPFTAMQP
jgi:O-antigen/teichoic acid export membrane protein